MRRTVPAHPPRRRRVGRAGPLLALGASAALLAACGEADLGEVVDGTSATAGADAVVDVTVTDDTCEVSTTAIDRGQVAFVVTNDGTQEVRFRFYSGGTDTIGEIPQVEAGQTRTLLVDSVVDGDYVAACTIGDDEEIRHSMRAAAAPL